MSRLLISGEASFLFSSCAECRTAVFLDELADLGPVELEQITLSSATSRMDGFDRLQGLLDQLLREEFTEGLENDAVADAEEEMERSWYDAIRIDGENTSRRGRQRECQ